MDFDEAIKAHSAWKMKLSTYLKKPDGSLKASDIQADNKCSLGQWIHGEGEKWSFLPEYSKLKTEHAKFHKAAAQVINKADSGQDTTEETALGAKSEFALASTAIVTAIMAIRKKAEG